jgi:hypothetical protein
MSYRLACMTSVIALAAAPAVADMNFNRIASFPVIENLPEGTDIATESSPEIIAATSDGNTLVYTDSPLGAIGMIDITEAADPRPLGVMMLDGEPTSVAVLGGLAFVGINTSESYTDPSGRLISVEVAAKAELGSCDLGGQPDSIAAAPDASFIAVAIENERDEDLNDGLIPQLPAGSLQLVPLVQGALDCENMITVDLTGLAEVAPSDPEPEFVDINGLGETVVTLQENNHIVVVARDGTVISHFSAGAVDLTGIDTTDERAR